MGGNSEDIADRLDPARAAALHAALGRSGAPPGPGDPLPPFWHQIYFWQALSPTNLGMDGHPAPGRGVIPDLGLPRRMWAGGKLAFHGPLLVGVQATRTTRLLNVTRKEGRSGALGFVTLRHEIRQRGTLAISEDQILVYRPPGASPAQPPSAPAQSTTAEVFHVDSTLLFRYSALTMNGHRIHYDADYARDVEGYSGLVVHGPLLATMLMDLAERREGAVSQFAFRATSPLCLPETASVCANGSTYWIRGEDGRPCMIGSTTR